MTELLPEGFRENRFQRYARKRADRFEAMTYKQRLRVILPLAILALVGYAGVVVGAVLHLAALAFICILLIVPVFVLFTVHTYGVLRQISYNFAVYTDRENKRLAAMQQAKAAYLAVLDADATARESIDPEVLRQSATRVDAAFARAMDAMDDAARRVM